jgi:hypothetical protein
LLKDRPCSSFERAIIAKRGPVQPGREPGGGTHETRLSMSW